MPNNIIFEMSVFSGSEPVDACVSHDGTCTGPHDCCAGLECHRNDVSWAQGRCYYKNDGGAGAACVGHDGVCSTGSECCPGTFCYKGQASWAHGRCYYNAPDAKQ